MKPILKSLLIISLCAFAFTDCKKFEDGPMFSLRTKKARVEGDWKIVKYTTDGVDVPFNSDFIIHIKKGGSYTINQSTNTLDGKWELGEDGDDLILTPNDASILRSSYRILKLKNKEMWWKEVKPNLSIDEIHLVQ